MSGDGGPLGLAPDQLRHRLALHAELAKSCEQSIAQAVADMVTMGTNFDAALMEGAHNVCTVSRQGGLEVQVIVKVGTAHEVRDDLWDAIMGAVDMDTGPTQYANAAMERLGFPTPSGGWPK